MSSLSLAIKKKKKKKKKKGLHDWSGLALKYLLKYSRTLFVS
jgi:hypothetical protein